MCLADRKVSLGCGLHIRTFRKKGIVAFGCGVLGAGPEYNQMHLGHSLCRISGGVSRGDYLAAGKRRSGGVLGGNYVAPGRGIGVAPGGPQIPPHLERGILAHQSKRYKSC